MSDSLEHDTWPGHYVYGLAIVNEDNPCSDLFRGTQGHSRALDVVMHVTACSVERIWWVQWLAR